MATIRKGSKLEKAILADAYDALSILTDERGALEDRVEAVDHANLSFLVREYGVMAGYEGDGHWVVRVPSNSSDTIRFKSLTMAQWNARQEGEAIAKACKRRHPTQRQPTRL